MKMNNLAQRTISAVIGIPIVVGLAYLGGWYFVGLAAFVVFIAQNEFYELRKDLMTRRHHIIGLILGVMLVVMQYDVPVMLDIAIFILTALLMYDTFQTDNARIWDQIAWMVVGLLYPAVIFSYFVPLRVAWLDTLTDLQHFYIPVSLLVMVWSIDTFAYVCGKSFGKHPLAPLISPKKTWEGAIGGFMGGLVAMIIMKITMLTFLSWVDIIICALIGGIGGQIGDLVQSRLKRIVGVKDSGRFMPGHGGIMDRIDGLILVVPLYYVYLNFVLG